MRSLNDFRQAKKLLLDGYDALLDDAVLEGTGLGQDMILGKQSDLAQERFVVAVCGQMKAGKSTLLNALVFGRPVLPSADTVMTAKITVLQFGPEESFEVEFYSDQDWKEVRSDSSSDPEQADAFAQEVMLAAQHGFPQHKFVLPQSRHERFAGFEALRTYVGTVQEGGLAAPFVKSVTVFHRHAPYQDVIVVDTPGVNDPNRVRNRITTSWLKTANAVVYVTYAGQALTDFDVRFMDEHLIHVPPSRRVIAVNKVDCAQSVASVTTFLDDLRRSGDPRLRSVFAAGTPTTPVSALGGLIDAMQRNGVALDGELEEMADILGDYIEPPRHAMGELAGQIEGRLMNDKGDGIVASHAEFIRSVFVRQRRYLEDAKEKLADRSALLAKSRVELESERDGISQLLVDVEELSKEFEDELTRAFDDRMMRLAEDLESLRDAMTAAVQSRIGEIGKPHHFAPQVAWILIDEFDRRKPAITRLATAARDDVQQVLDRAVREIQAPLARISKLRLRRLDALIQVSASWLLRPAGASLEGKMNQVRIAEIVEAHANFFQRLLGTSGGVGNVRNALEPEVGKTIHAVFDDQVNAVLVEKLRERKDSARSAVFGSVQGVLDDKREYIEQLLARRDATQGDIDAVEQEIVVLDQRIASNSSRETTCLSKLEGLQA